MAKTFRAWDVDQGWLLPPSLHEFVPPGHMAHFVRDTVREALDLSAILDTYTEERGYPPYHPGMMVALLLYGYSRGLYSSRQLARACEERVDFLALIGLNRPDFRTVAEFRKRHLAALSDLFVQVLRLCRAAGLVQFAHVAIDGTKLKASASRHKAMSYGRMKAVEPGCHGRDAPAIGAVDQHQQLPVPRHQRADCRLHHERPATLDGDGEMRARHPGQRGKAGAYLFGQGDKYRIARAPVPVQRGAGASGRGKRPRRQQLCGAAHPACLSQPRLPRQYRR